MKIEFLVARCMHTSSVHLATQVQRCNAFAINSGVRRRESIRLSMDFRVSEVIPQSEHRRHRELRPA